MPDLAGQKTLYVGFCGVIDSEGVSRIASTLNGAVNEQFDCVYLCFNSLGGYVGDGIYLYHHIRGLPLNVLIHNTGTVASIATTIFVAAAHRICSSNSVFMIHPVAAPAGGNMAAEPLQAALDAALADEARLENILRERTTIAECILARRRTTDVYLTAEQALENGLAHEIREFSLPTGNKIFHI
jgi:ATP-dependent protease ClpP protease subunit